MRGLIQGKDEFFLFRLFFNCKQNMYIFAVYYICCGKLGNWEAWWDGYSKNNINGATETLYFSLEKTSHRNNIYGFYNNRL